MMPHLLRCQRLAVKYYGFALGRLGSGVPSAFATTGSIQSLDNRKRALKAREAGRTDTQFTVKSDLQRRKGEGGEKGFRC